MNPKTLSRRPLTSPLRRAVGPVLATALIAGATMACGDGATGEDPVDFDAGGSSDAGPLEPGVEVGEVANPDVGQPSENDGGEPGD